MNFAEFNQLCPEEEALQKWRCGEIVCIRNVTVTSHQQNCPVKRRLPPLSLPVYRYGDHYQDRSRSNTVNPAAILPEIPAAASGVILLRGDLLYFTWRISSLDRKFFCYCPDDKNIKHLFKKEKQTTPWPPDRFNFHIFLPAFVNMQHILCSLVIPVNIQFCILLTEPFFFFSFLKNLFFRVDSVLGANLCWHIGFPLRSTSRKRQWEMFSLLVLGVCEMLCFAAFCRPRS